MSEHAGRRGLPLQMRMRHDTHFVEELAQHGEPIGRLLPIAAIEPDPHQPRSSMGNLDELVASIRDKGVLEPILVRPISGSGLAGEPSHRIISGERRLHAADEAGLLEVPVIEMEVGEEEALEIALVENLQRKDLTPFEEAEGYQSLADRHGYSHEQIAGAVGKSRTVVTEALSLLRMPARARTAVQALGIQSRSTVLEILKATRDEDEMIGMLEQVAHGGLNRDDIRAQSRSRRAPRTQRRKPYVFKFRAPDKTYSLAMSFRKSTVDKDDLIGALERILEELRNAPEEG